MIRLSTSRSYEIKTGRILEYSGECIWIPDDDIEAAKRMAKALERIEKARK
jgi:hypothetical protein